MRTAILAIACALTLAGTSCGDEEAAPFTLAVTPPRIDDAIPGQRVVLLATTTEAGEAGDPVAVSARTSDEFAGRVELTVGRTSIVAGEVAEVTVVPGAVTDGEPGAATPPPEMPPAIGPGGVIVPVTVTAARGEIEREVTVLIQVSGGEDTVTEYATELRARFVSWLATERPDLGITEATAWTPTIVKPHILVVTHYLFFSEEWEMSLMWHVTIAPYDWSRIYLRPRSQVLPTLAFEIPSVSDPASLPHEIDPPAEIDR